MTGLSSEEAHGRVRPRALAAWLGVLGTTVASAVVAQDDLGLFLAGAAGFTIMATSAWLAFKKPAGYAAVLVVGFCVQPMLKFYITPYFGPLKDFAALLAVVAAAAYVVRRGPSGREDPWLCFLPLALIGLYLVNVAGHYDAGWMAAARLTVEALALFLAGYLGENTKGRWKAASAALIVIGCVEAVIGVVQQSLGSHFLVTQFGFAFGEQVRETASGQFRSFGTFDEPFSYAAVLLLALVAVTQGRPRDRWTPAIALVLAVGVYVSYSRTDMVIAAVVLGLWMLRLGHRMSLTLLALSALAAGTLFLLWQSSPAGPAGPGSLVHVLTSLNGRTGIWARVIGDPWNLIAGRGVGEVGTGLARGQAGLIVQQQSYVPGQAPMAADLSNLSSIDNSYLAVIADVGLPGVLLILATGGLLVRAVRSASGEARLGFVLMGFLLVIAMDALTRSSLFAFPFGFVAMYVLGTVASALAATGGESPTRGESEMAR